MLKKVMVILATKYLAIKAKMRAIETRLIIHSLLLRDKKVVRHLFRRRRYFYLADEDNIAAVIATTDAPVSILHLAEENKMKMRIEEDDNDKPNTVEDVEDYQSDNIAALINNSTAITTPVSILQLAEEMREEEEMGINDDNEFPDLRHSDDQLEDQSISVIEMVKNAKEGQGKEFRLEDDIDQVADLFIQRFHHQIRLQKFHPEPPLSYSSV